MAVTGTVCPPLTLSNRHPFEFKGVFPSHLLVFSH